MKRFVFWGAVFVFVFNNFVFGGIIGDATRVASIHLEEKKGRAGLAATFLDRFVGLLAMCGFAVAGSAVLLLTKGAHQGEKIPVLG